jgi:hypothetical protein
VSSNYYQLTLASCADIIAGEVLCFNVTSPDGSQSSVTEHPVTQDEVNGGGISNFNITLGTAESDTSSVSNDIIRTTDKTSRRGDFNQSDHTST